MTNQLPSFISPQCSPEELQLDQTLKLGVMASGSGTNFEALAQAIADKRLNAQIQVVIYNNPDAKVQQRAQRWNIPTVLINHRHYKKNREGLDQKIVEVLKQHEVEWVIMAGWMRIITPVLLNAFPNHVLNIHPSLLPSFKGVNGVEQALAAGVKVTGCTVHIASLEVDSGPIVMQAAVPILPDDTPDTLHARIQVQEHLIFPMAIALAAKKY
ncbi:phosphoribosylglycinamide formyltransferase [Gloeothece verrucosa]|uniref:Phosphoribosylglycinamide formyltransferase n=1 Tax=Gloeothece verrucosa (strain PCC 7822) TaxID=497965 RepID=E0UF82_GLOV7|nr:phosphoribosylglycinamide formyltransferase [Gloeothece verrucosa]ADN15453.1 phosphoribosylglycinamide formyltransferase [Gloeothece verrucosa PCC 7822]